MAERVLSSTEFNNFIGEIVGDTNKDINQTNKETSDKNAKPSSSNNEKKINSSTVAYIDAQDNQKTLNNIKKTVNIINKNEKK